MIILRSSGSYISKNLCCARINLEGHRHRVRRYAHELRKLIRIGQGPETLLRQSSSLAANVGSDGYFDNDVSDAIEAHEWKCVRTVNGKQLMVFLSYPCKIYARQILKMDLWIFSFLIVT